MRNPLKKLRRFDGFELPWRRVHKSSVSGFRRWLLIEIRDDHPLWNHRLLPLAIRVDRNSLLVAVRKGPEVAVVDLTKGAPREVRTFADLEDWIARGMNPDCDSWDGKLSRAELPPELEEREQVARENGLPLHEHINLSDSGDEQCAAFAYLGKNLEEVERMYREDGLFEHMDDLLFMGGRAYCFYVDAAIRYLRSTAADGDDEGLPAFISLFKFRLTQEPQAMLDAVPKVRGLCRYLVDNLDRYGRDPVIDADVPQIVEALLKRLEALP